MGLVSLLPKLAGYGKTAVRYAGKSAKIAPEIIFGKGAETFVNTAGKVTKGANESWFKAAGRAVKEGGKAVEASMAATKAAKGSLLSRTWNTIISAPGKTWNLVKTGYTSTKGGFFAKLGGSFKGLGKAFGKGMPLIGSLLLIGMEAPNIVQATKEKGLWQGIKETVKAGARLVCGAIGSAICAPLGFLGVAGGWMGGEWLASKIIGKSYTEQKAEEEQKQAELISQLGQYQQQMQPAAAQQVPFMGNPYQAGYGLYNTNPYNDDIMMQQAFNMYA